jgi:proline iminopeptidase
MKKTILLLLVGICTISFLFSTNGSFYKPGRLRTEKGLRSPLTPPSQEGVDQNHFKVAEDILLYYFRSGEGRPILVIHGGPGSPSTEPWPGLEELKKDFMFYYYHQRGCGHSTRPVDTFESQNFMKNAFSLDKVLGLSAQLADIERIRRILKQEKLILIGHSYGGFLASLYAVEFPEHVEKMVLIAPANVLKMPIEDGGFDEIREFLTEEEKAEFDDFLRRYFDYGKIFSKNEKELSSLNSEYGRFYKAVYKHLGLKFPEGPDEDLVLMGGWMVHAMYLSLGLKYDLTEDLKKVPAPVLVLHGEKDLMPAKASKKYADLFPQGRLKILPDVTHFPFLEDPLEFAKIVKTFL